MRPKCSDKAAIIDDDQTKMWIKNNPGNIVWDRHYVSDMSIVRYPKTLGYMDCYDAWVAHYLIEKNEWTAFLSVILCSNTIKTTHFSKEKWSLAMKNGLFNTMWSERDPGEN